MTRKWGDTGLGVMGSRHVLTITYPEPDETLFDTPEAIPTSEPETPQVEYTIAAAHLPSISGARVVWSPILYASGYNDTAGAVTLSYRLMKNDVSVQTGTQSVTAGRYWTVNCYNYYDSAVGDKIQLSLWASGAGLDWRYKALAVLATRIYLGTNSGDALLSSVWTMGRRPILALGNPVVALGGAWYWYNGNMAYNVSIAATITITILPAHAQYAHGRFFYGDGGAGNTSYGASTTAMPYYIQNNVPTQIIYYPLAVR